VGFLYKCMLVQIGLHANVVFSLLQLIWDALTSNPNTWTTEQWISVSIFIGICLVFLCLLLRMILPKGSRRERGAQSAAQRRQEQESLQQENELRMIEINQVERAKKASLQTSRAPRSQSPPSTAKGGWDDIDLRSNYV